MEKSESIINISKALHKFQSEVHPIKKDANNPFFKSKYATLDGIQEVIKKPLYDSGLIYTQHPEGDNELTTLLIHAETGEFLSSSYLMASMKKDPQSIGSAITYQKRYALAAILGLTIEDCDDDGNYASKTDKTETTTKPAASVQTEDNRPWMNEKALNDCKARILKGETDVYNKADKAFKMKTQYREELKKFKKP